MKVKHMFENDFDIDLICGKDYEVMSIEKGLFRIVDESKEDYLYPPYLFEVVEEEWKTEEERELVRRAKVRIEESTQYYNKKYNTTLT